MVRSSWLEGCSGCIAISKQPPLLPCKSPKADPGLAMASPPANFLKLVSLELGRGLDDAKPPPRPVNPSRLDCLMFAKALQSNVIHVHVLSIYDVAAACIDVECQDLNERGRLVLWPKSKKCPEQVLSLLLLLL